MRSKTVLVVTGIAVAVGVIAFFRWRALEKPRPHWEEDVHKADAPAARQTLEVGFLPVTCHLTCPVTDYASRTSTTGTAFDALRFTEFPPIVEAITTKKLMAGFVNVPIAMKMKEQGAPVKIVCLGHRDGSSLICHKDLNAKSVHDLIGKTIALPNMFSNENFFFHKLMNDTGLKPDQFKFVVLPPPDMPASLAAKAIDAFVVAEPFPAKAERDGYGKILHFAKDIWPNYISCCLIVHEDLIKERRAVVDDLVRGICESGEWTEQNRTDAATLVSPYFRQDRGLLEFVLTQPADRVTYRNLRPSDVEMQKIMDMGFDLGFLKKKVSLDDLLDRSFIPDRIMMAKIDLARMSEILPKQAPPAATKPASSPKADTKK